jgi:hypothetical protein
MKDWETMRDSSRGRTGGAIVLLMLAILHPSCGRVTVSPTRGVLFGLSVTPASLAAGATGTVTVSFITQFPWPADGKVSITFPAGFDASGATFGSAVGADGTFAPALVGQTVTLTRAGGTAVLEGRTVTIVLGNVRNPTSFGTTGSFTIATQTAAAVTIDDGTAAGVLIGTGALGGPSVIPATLVATATGNVSVTFTLENPWPADGRLQVVFPAGFNVSAATFGSASGADGSFLVVVSAQTVTAVRSGGTAASGGSAVTVTLISIMNPSTIGVTGTFSLTTQTAATTPIDQGTAAGVTITPGALTSVTFTPASLMAGAAGTATVGFTTSTPWPGDGKAVIVFPAGFNVSAVTGGAVSGANGTVSAAAVGQTLTLTRGGGATATAGATAVTIALGNLKNPGVSGTTGSFMVMTQTSSGTAIDGGTAAGVIMTAGSLSGVSVVPASLAPSATGNVTVSFTTANPWPKTGKVVIVFPAGFNVSGATAGTMTGADGTLSVAVAGQTVTFTRSGVTTVAGGSAVTISLGGVMNPSTSGATGTFTVTTQTPGSAAIDTAVAPGVTIA